MEKVQTMTGNLFYFKKIIEYLKKHPQIFTDVVAIGIGGSPVPESVLHALQALFPSSDIYVIYGSSEAEPIAIRKLNKEKINESWGYCVGEIHPSISCKIKELGKIKIKENLFSCGEIQVKGKHVVVPDGADYLFTGDFGYIDEENQLFLTGRKGNEKLHHNVQHYQIEHALNNINELEQVACMSKNKGFDIYVKGKVKEQDIEDTLKECFSENISYTINYIEKIPVDNRHFSKIIYSKLK